MVHGSHKIYIFVESIERIGFPRPLIVLTKTLMETCMVGMPLWVQEHRRGVSVLHSVYKIMYNQNRSGSHWLSEMLAHVFERDWWLWARTSYPMSVRLNYGCLGLGREAQHTRIDRKSRRRQPSSWILFFLSNSLSPFFPLYLSP